MIVVLRALFEGIRKAQLLLQRLVLDYGELSLISIRTIEWTQRVLHERKVLSRRKLAKENRNFLDHLVRF